MKRTARRFDPLPPERHFPAGLNWFALAVTSRREYQVARWLEDGRGWFTLVPLFEKWVLAKKIRGGKLQAREKKSYPLLGGFVFAGHIGTPDWTSLDSAFHIRGPLNCAGVPLCLPESQILRFQQGAATEAAKARTRGILKEGGRARVMSGAYQGHELDVTKIKGPWAEVLIPLFGTSIQGRVAVDSLEALEAVAA
jgi:hypothetical protein